MPMMPAILIFVGGSLGAIVRELFMLMLGRYSAVFPVDIFAANILASFLLGLTFTLTQAHLASTNLNLFIATGACGGMSTFSSFVYGSYSEMLRPGQLAAAISYIVASLVVGFAATWIGMRVVSRPVRPRYAAPRRQK
jgi:CrcB protein